jgi:hypothetical protein
LILELIQKVGMEEAVKLTAKELNLPVEDVYRVVINMIGKDNFCVYAENNLYIEDDRIIDGEKIVPFKLNSAQRLLDEAIESQASRGIPVRLIHLKPRQYGATTYFDGRIFREIMTKRNLHATTISYVNESASHIRGIAGRFYDRLKDRKPDLKGRGEKLWRFPSLDNTWMIESAENLSAGHSFTNQILHVSEISRWERDVDMIMRGLTSSVQSIPGTMIIIESTANGYGDYFHETWKEARKGKNPYLPIFIAWYQIEKYSMGFTKDVAWDGRSKSEFEKTLDPIAKGLRNNGVSLEQLHWRNWKIQGDLRGSEESFFEQYPSNEDEAFLHSGRPYFPITIIRQKLIQTEQVEKRVGYLEWKENKTKVEFYEDRHGWWEIYEESTQGYKNVTVIGADVAEGVANDENKDPDFSVCGVRDRVKKRRIAKFRARVDTDVFAEEIQKANLYFECVLVCPERNSAGTAVIQYLKEIDEVTLYRDQEFGKVEDKENVVYGFRTLQGNREVGLSDLRLAIKEKSFDTNDHEFWVECSTFVIDKTGKAQAQGGEHDDEVMAGMLELQADNQAGQFFRIVPKEEVVVVQPDNDKYEEVGTSVYAEY